MKKLLSNQNTRLTLTTKGLYMRFSSMTFEELQNVSPWDLDCAELMEYSIVFRKSVENKINSILQEWDEDIKYLQGEN